jgi:hypothetical protein
VVVVVLPLVVLLLPQLLRQRPRQEEWLRPRRATKLPPPRFEPRFPIQPTPRLEPRKRRGPRARERVAWPSTAKPRR